EVDSYSRCYAFAAFEFEKDRKDVSDYCRDRGSPDPEVVIVGYETHQHHGSGALRDVKNISEQSGFDSRTPCDVCCSDPSRADFPNVFTACEDVLYKQVAKRDRPQ